MFRRETGIGVFADMSQDGYGLMRLKAKKEKKLLDVRS